MKSQREAAKILAGQLNGAEYGNEITKDQERYAKENGLLVMFGYSDDNVELRGAINEEIGATFGGVVEFYGLELFNRDECECNCKYSQKALEMFENRGKSIKAMFGEDAEDEYSWTFVAPFHVETFDVMEDGEKFCRGIVFPIRELIVDHFKIPFHPLKEAQDE